MVKNLKFLYYDWMSSTVECLDLGVQNTLKHHRDIGVAFFNDEIEDKLYQDPVNFGTINTRDHSDFFMGNFQRTIYTYSISSNNITAKQINTGDLVSYYNGKMDSISLSSLNTGNHNPPANVKFSNKMSYWNNDLDLYDEISRNLLEDNSLTLNVVGDLTFRIGGIVNVSVSTDPRITADSDQNSTLFDLKNRYDTFNGLWFVSGIDYIVSPTKKIFRQRIRLFRNFLNNRTFSSESK